VAQVSEEKSRFPPTDAICQELEKKATEEGISLDEAWKRKEEGRRKKEEGRRKKEGPSPK